MDTIDSNTNYKFGIISAIITALGTVFSGPLAFIAVSSIKPQPAWASVEIFVENFHPIQSVTFYFGFLLIIGSVCMIAFIYDRQKDIHSLIALVFTGIAATLISFNYFIEATFVPALIRNYTPSLDPIIKVFAVTNPFALFWAIEMWGYGFLGLGTIFVIDFFSTKGIEGWTRILFLVNGIVSIVGALYSSIYLEWVLTTAGLISYALWNVLYLVLAIMFWIVLVRRRSMKVDH